MDEPSSITERSSFDELRAIQAQFEPKAIAETLGYHGDAEPTPISPSEIINSVEQDNLENPEQVPPQSVNASSASWGTQSGPALFGHGSESTSNVTPLATTAPASGAIDQGHDINMAFTAGALSSAMDPEFQIDNAPTTITPSALLTKTPDAVLQNDPGLHGSDNSIMESQDDQDFGILRSEDTAANEYIIALPPASRLRTQVLDILRSHQTAIRSFTEMFSTATEAVQLLDKKVTTKIDAMLRTLSEMSNLPPYHEDLPTLTQEEWMKYGRDTCSKMAFVFELLERLRNIRMEVVIIAQAGPIIEKLEAIVSQCGLTNRYAGQEAWQNPRASGSACKVVLTDTSRSNSQPHKPANIVIAYDETAETSGHLQPYKSRRLEDQIPLIFSLVEVYSLEHINRRLSPTMQPPEKKLAQVRCLVEMPQVLDDDMAYEQVPLPHEFAGDLVKYMVDDDSNFQAPETRWQTWEHQNIPEHVFDAYKISRCELAPYHSRKRPRDESGDETETSKRLRLGLPKVQASDRLKARFGDVRVKGNKAEVSLEKLEDLVGLVNELKSALDKKSEEVEGWVKMMRATQPKYHEAIGDRGKFEVQRNQAIKERDKLQKELERNDARLVKLTEEKRDLEARLKYLANSDDPNLAAAAQREADAKAAQDNAANLERQIKSVHDDLVYARSRYQDASDKAAALGKENSELKVRIKDLETRANDNLAEIHKINAQRTDRHLRAKYEREKAVREDRERELDRKAEDLRNYKSKFGSRETRGTSVPRSPRMRQMSSRNTSPVADNGNGGNGGGPSVMSGPRTAHLKRDFQ